MLSIRNWTLAQETGALADGSKKTHHVIVFYGLMAVKRWG
jgi:hypothetical protein